MYNSCLLVILSVFYCNFLVLLLKKFSTTMKFFKLELFRHFQSGSWISGVCLMCLEKIVFSCDSAQGAQLCVKAAVRTPSFGELEQLA